MSVDILSSAAGRRLAQYASSRVTNYAREDERNIRRRINVMRDFVPRKLATLHPPISHAADGGEKPVDVDVSGIRDRSRGRAIGEKRARRKVSPKARTGLVGLRADELTNAGSIIRGFDAPVIRGRKRPSRCPPICGNKSKFA